VSPTSVMVGASVATWALGAIGALATTVAGWSFAIDSLFGMLGPLLVAVGSWELASQTYRRTPERLTGLMVTAFAGKMVFFGAYVALMLMGLSLRPIPFVLSFTAYFIGLHLIEAMSLRRLFAEGASR
jgi:hypothetical protein